jgi:hypothetical protein
LKHNAYRRRLIFNGDSPLPALAHLKTAMMRSPLEIIAAALLLFPALDPRSEKLFSAYDEFLGLLADDVKRERLDTISYDDLKTDPTFKQAQQISYRFWDAVSAIFLNQDNLLGHLTIEYGVF